MNKKCLLLALFCITFCFGKETLLLDFGKNFHSVPKERIEKLISSVGQDQFYIVSDDPQFTDGDIVLSFGNTHYAQQIITQHELDTLGSEGFVVRSQQIDNKLVIAVRGNHNTEKNVCASGDTNIGLLYGAYSLLQQMGFAFLHPLEPTLPTKLTIPQTIDSQEKPYWPIRAWHLHTQHPLELTDMLNGWGPQGPQDRQGWEQTLPEWDVFLEWMIANKQNRVEWVLLMAKTWQQFADSRERQERLHTLVDMGHNWGIAVGIDAPIILRQQHSWLMVRQLDGTEIQQIHKAIDWLHEAGFDYFEIEMGFSEFTHPSPQKMLSWMDAASTYAENTYQKRTYVKVHCSQHQKAEGYKDPETGEELNFNFLPYYADKSMGVLPHSVQFYSLTDPAPTYGGKDFSEIRRYMQMEAGKREVVWYPETAYWVSFDINVPIFLPIYSDRRFFDLRLIAQDEIQGKMGRGAHAGSRIQGQVNFSSGWEWGYWLNDVVTARAVWNPMIEETDHKTALRKLLNDIFSTLGDGSTPVTETIMELIQQQEDLLIFGKVNGKSPKSIEKRNGTAYIQGYDTWMDMSNLTNAVVVCPSKKGLIDMRNPIDEPPYDAEVKPVLRAMDEKFNAVADEFSMISGSVATSGRKIFDELNDAIRITALRAKQVHNLYETVDEIMDNSWNGTLGKAPQRLAEARRCLDKAQVIVRRQETRYRVDLNRIAGWRYNPTAYNYGYLWTAHSLVYWWRDEGKVVDQPASPGYLNFIDPINVANGEGEWVIDDEIPIIGGLNITQLRKELIKAFGNDSFLKELLTRPKEEPQYPQNDLRTRPEWCQDW
ncbi:hypothetical protein [Candidatus Uabimicrobium sp. HlEnr_7]|uniref:hypothetical protein n=1 Tax=Candidatus Uabimicrobium helgolandensis TaxID=3095367 RepID=UPI00355828FF